eukprot:4141524-Pleurochrysis_carterae.AAC.1
MQRVPSPFAALVPLRADVTAARACALQCTPIRLAACPITHFSSELQERSCPLRPAFLCSRPGGVPPSPVLRATPRATLGP